ncbi:hypothetical protein VOLCADRAFT_117908 [Volvox carteri f. nagariensis]|uniref:N-acetyltransferase domain-containing protein n=1 Tax=Volvox carteri f. nagariensis TaxID=3068 RepID=D8TZ90_VOLCA|nr:uncharacterized protein VOLCADRAFT_117908 [Volvox carteri f. nagariensis]EFJ47140.1 hypothetical protein VOLCADRAFT_117908 [Volvox carteri f. nagariensis]|eukprot:XP_002951689.1 hypothetical protein VOLCADRAFT_117908 [Volvox carteri f. nagariensis]
MATAQLNCSLRVFCPEDDPTVADHCCETIAQGFASEPNNGLFSADPSQFAARWRAIAYNTLLRSRGVPLVHCLSLGQAPGQEPVPDDAPEPPDIIDLAGITRPEAMPVRDDLLSYMSVKKAEFLDSHGSFEYVAFLATHPEHWGKGLGSQLLGHVTDKADAAGRWCYLEATNPDNVRLYERHGFRQLETKTWSLESLPGQRIMLIPMARPPLHHINTA